MATLLVEVQKIAEQFAAKGKPLREDDVIAACKDARKYPLLHAHVWQLDAETALLEARRERVRQLIVRISFKTEAGDNVRYLTHVRGTPGYRTMEEVAIQPDLAIIKLDQFYKEVQTAHARLVVFRRMIDPAVLDEIEVSLGRINEAVQKQSKRGKSSARIAT